MGMDISGKNPIHNTPKPPKPDVDYHIDKEAWKLYFEEEEKWLEKNHGHYFRANIWSWSPILMLCYVADDKYDLDMDFSYWDSNDGAGLDTQEQCNILADALEKVCISFFDLNEVDEVQFCRGTWINADTNGFVSSKISEELSSEYPDDTILTTSIILDDGTRVKSASSVTKDHVHRFISFLRECGGFEIW